MRHFTSEQWADFARGLVENKEKTAMQEHLRSGCRSCAEEVELWLRVSRTAKRQPSDQPSSGAVRYAKALFAARARRNQKRERVPVAALLFDSLLTPASGVRSSGAGSRQLLFGLGDHRIDVRLEPQLDSERVNIIGQVLDSSNPASVFPKRAVSLYSGEKKIAASETNEFGEFQLECRPGRRLKLCAALPGGQKVSLALPEPTAPAVIESSPFAGSAKAKKLPSDSRKSSE